jgi:hypothetical protein
VTEEEIKALEQDLDWDARYLDVLGLDYGSRLKDAKV